MDDVSEVAWLEPFPDTSLASPAIVAFLDADLTRFGLPAGIRR